MLQHPNEKPTNEKPTTPRRARQHAATTRLAMCIALLATQAAAANAKLAVVATLPDLAAIAAEVGGDAVNVTALASAAEDPHNVDPRPSLILHINRTKLLIVNGLDLEIGWLPPLIVNARNAEIQRGAAGYFDASQFVERLDVPTTRIDRSMGDVHPGGNPHFTFDPRQATRIAVALGDAMAKRDPSHASDYATRASAFAQRLQAFADAQATRFRALPKSQRKIVTYHGSLSYLAAWLGLDVVDCIEPRPGVPPHPSHIAAVLAHMRADAATIIVQEEHHPRGTSATLAELANGRLLIVAAATRFNAGETYLTHLTKITEDLHDALSRSSA